jgi:hypothetical protein
MATYITDSTGERVKIEKTHKFRNFVVLPILAVIALVVIIAASSGGGSSAPATAPGNGPAAPAGTSNGTVVLYEVTGAGTGSITYVTDGNMSMAQDTEASLPWSTEVTMDSGFAPVSLSVQHMSGSGPVTCKITVDGEVVSENHANGEFAIASCSGGIQ